MSILHFIFSSGKSFMKITCMLIGTAQRIATVTNELNINLENQLIKNVNTQKLLGIYTLLQ
jgi:hypothetical protein